jgi:hypothetical protein
MSNISLITSFETWCNSSHSTFHSFCLLSSGESQAYNSFAVSSSRTSNIGASFIFCSRIEVISKGLITIGSDSSVAARSIVDSILTTVFSSTILTTNLYSNQKISKTSH